MKNVIYKVVREFRIYENKALFAALDFCKNNNGQEVFVVYSKSNIDNWRSREKISKNVLGFIESIVFDFQKQIQDFVNSKYFKNNYPNIKLNFVIVENNNVVVDIYNLAKANNVSQIFTDYTPMREQKKFFDNFVNKINNQEFVNINIIQIDSRNIFDITKVSDKEEFSAATFRRKWVKLLKQENINNRVQSYFVDNRQLLELKSIHNIRVNNILQDFINNKLENYFEYRNNANVSGQSDLSPFINLGVISRKYLLYYILHKFDLKVEDIFSENKNGSDDKSNIEESKLIKSLKSFVEEVFIRYELAENYCYYNHNYDNLSGARDWARQTLQKGKTDKRQYIYSLQQFENSQTHDDLWNVCQKDLRINGKLNGYLRMFWCKKVLEWSDSPESAINIAVYLNNKYSLDGYAPPSYTGILWSIAGLHDRAWFPRPIFGNIRYMATSGVEKRMNIKSYFEKINLKINLLKDISEL